MPKHVPVLAVALAALGACTLESEEIGSRSTASHSWGDYHWARTTSSFDLRVVKSTTAEWSPYVDQANADWSDSAYVNLVGETGGTHKRIRRKCDAPDGTVRVCNLSYGNTGWLGIAGISLDNNNHIVSGYTKLNDTYFSSGYYDDPAWKLSVTCQELGHDLGLDHQDEDFNNQSLESCMDYQDPPYEYPNSHDYEELAAIYEHLDSYDSYDSSDGGGGDDGGGGNGCNAPPGKGCNKGETASGDASEWGQSLGRHGRVEFFVRPNGDGTLEVTRVVWAH